MALKAEATLVAELPGMSTADLARFEAEGGVWGQQRAVRRQQLQVTAAGVAGFVFVGTAFCLGRGNTRLVALGTAPIWAMCGASVGHHYGLTLFPSVACNKETSMMRRLWWAQQCAKGWDMSQVDAGKWRAKYPAVPLLKANEQ